jgi:hypothetical protein
MLADTVAFKVEDRVANVYTEELGTVKAVSDDDPTLPQLFWVRMDDGYYVTCYASDLEHATHR